MTPEDEEKGYRPRPNDHLVEPFFAGLPSNDDDEADDERVRAKRSWLARLLDRLRGRRSD